MLFHTIVPEWLAEYIPEKFEHLFTVALFIIFGSQLVVLFQYSRQTRLFPLITNTIALSSIILLYLMKTQYIIDMIKKVRSSLPLKETVVNREESPSTKSADSGLDVSKIIIMMVWVVAYLMLILQFPFILVTFAFLVAFYRLYAFDSWIYSIGLAIAICLPIWLVITVVLGGISI